MCVCACVHVCNSATAIVSQLSAPLSLWYHITLYLPLGSAAINVCPLHLGGEQRVERGEKNKCGRRKPTFHHLVGLMSGGGECPLLLLFPALLPVCA